ncbi:hypothetical protein L1887_23373 [Cichorium endivia]|nr:hypothetical protein L1887_23373 [Cichorium endivia]
MLESCMELRTEVVNFVIWYSGYFRHKLAFWDLFFCLALVWLLCFDAQGLRYDINGEEFEVSIKKLSDPPIEDA